MKRKTIVAMMTAPALLMLAAACERLDRPSDYADAGEQREEVAVPLPELADLFASLPLDVPQMEEVRDAVASSVGNGYDEEYMMADLFAQPGKGVGEERLTTRSSQRTDAYAEPIRGLLEARIRERMATRSGGDATLDAEAYLERLKSSGLQLYWPYSDSWDGETLPVITYDPGDGSDKNVGYRLVDRDGIRRIETVTVTEQMARETPVWVLNGNDDAGFATIEVLRKNDPDWGRGGSVTVKGEGESLNGKTLLLKRYKMRRQYDSWFRGGSEFWCKAGSVEDFTASTDAEMRLFTPSITDFMIVVRRAQAEEWLNIDTVLVSEWTEQLEKIAFMLVEDDGGSRTSWKCSAVVKVQSKSYGFEIELPFRSYDDIVWRGQLTRKYFEKNIGTTGRFADVDIEFAFE